MKKTTYLFIVIAGLIITSCNDDSNIAGPQGAVSSDSYIFVACEGNYYEPESGSISIIDEYGNITSINNIGSVVQSASCTVDGLVCPAVRGCARPWPRCGRWMCEWTASHCR